MIVQCNGPCQDVNIFLCVSDGDPALFALDYARPQVQGGSCSDCWGFCRSDGPSIAKAESCTNINTDKNSFYVVVYAYSYIGNGTITFENVESAEEYGRWNPIIFYDPIK